MSNNEIPAILLQKLHESDVGFTLVRGVIFYHDIAGYKTGQKIIKAIDKQLPRQGYNKYGNRKVKMMLTLPVYEEGFLVLPVPQPVTFDSEDEADRYFYLKDMQDAGIVRKIELHPRLELFGSFVDLDGKKQQHIIYTPDFYIEYVDGRREYEDVKGYSYEAGDLRRKLYDFLAARSTNRPFYGVPLRWISRSFKYGDADGWIDSDELERIRAGARKAKKGAA